MTSIQKQTELRLLTNYANVLVNRSLFALNLTKALQCLVNRYGKVTQRKNLFRKLLSKFSWKGVIVRFCVFNLLYQVFNYLRGFLVQLSSQSQFSLPFPSKSGFRHYTKSYKLAPHCVFRTYDRFRSKEGIPGSR